MTKNINDMTNKELAKFCKDNDIHVDSKNVSKPTKAEYILAIEENQAGPKEVASAEEAMDTVLSDKVVELEGLDTLEDVEEFLNIEEEEDGDQEAETPKVKELTRAEKRKKQWQELMPLRRVIINSNDNNQTRIKNQVEFCTWGNRLLGHHTDRFIVGKPWHVREGALRNLENKQTSLPIQDEEGNTVRFETVPAYVIQRLDQLSKVELENIAKRQIIRDNSIDNLV